MSGPSRSARWSLRTSSQRWPVSDWLAWIEICASRSRAELNSVTTSSKLRGDFDLLRDDRQRHELVLGAELLARHLLGEGDPRGVVGEVGVLDLEARRGGEAVVEHRRVGEAEERPDAGVAQPAQRLAPVVAGDHVVAVVDDQRHPRVQRVERPRVVADVHVLRPVHRPEVDAPTPYVVFDRPVRAHPTQRVLPGVQVGVGEAGDRDLAAGVDHLRVGHPEVRPDRDERVVLDQDVALADVAEPGSRVTIEAPSMTSRAWPWRPLTGRQVIRLGRRGEPDAADPGEDRRGDQDDRAGEPVLPRFAEFEEGDRVDHLGQQQRAEHGAEEGAAAAVDRGAAEDDRADRLQRVALARGRVAGADLHRQHHRRERREGARDAVGGDPREADVDAHPVRRRLVRADRAQGEPEPAAPQRQLGEDRDHDADDEHDRDAGDGLRQRFGGAEAANRPVGTGLISSAMPCTPM